MKISALMLCCGLLAGCGHDDPTLAGAQEPPPGGALAGGGAGAGAGSGEQATWPGGGASGKESGGGAGGAVGSHEQRAVVTTHPRIWITAQDLPRLRSWATPANPLWANGMAQLAKRAKGDMDAGLVPAQDAGVEGWSQYPTEMYAQLFAFLSLVDPDAGARDDYAQRARALLMTVMNEAAQGPAPGVRFRDPLFATRNRSRWWGDCFGTTVDWIYPHLSAQDKATIRTTFMWWIGANLNASTTDYNHPVPQGVENHASLLADKRRVRWSSNNYYNAHMRNIGLMALALDAADDPGNQLRGYLANATGAWLYVSDHFLRTDARGGIGPEGNMYTPASVGYVAQLLLALRTAGHDNSTLHGKQVVLDQSHPFWRDVVPAFLHTVSPVPVVLEPWVGPVYLPAPYGDAQVYYLGDPIEMLGPLALHDGTTGNAQRLHQIRWIQRNLAPGGAAKLAQRANPGEPWHNAMFYFMLFDPQAAVEPDPRPQQPLQHFAAGLGHLYSRTSWGADAVWFRYQLPWLTVDHQHGDGNHFGFYRKGEWLTKDRTGWVDVNFQSDYHNTLTLQNDPPKTQEGPVKLVGDTGSQHIYGNGEGKLVRLSAGKHYVHITGDATELYNSVGQGATDITHASRSLLWLKPDHIVIYDRAASKTAGRFKRFWLQLPGPCSIIGDRATTTTAKGQQLVSTTLLPAGAALSCGAGSGKAADFEPMTHRLTVEAAGAPSQVQFLHVLQGVDAGGAAQPATLVQSSAGAAYQGAVLGGTTAVLFQVGHGGNFTGTTYEVAAGITTHVITGLTPHASYDVTQATVAGQHQITVQPGAALAADVGGVLVWPAGALAPGGAVTSPSAPAAPAPDGGAPPAPAPSPAAGDAAVAPAAPSADGAATALPGGGNVVGGTRSASGEAAAGIDPLVDPDDPSLAGGCSVAAGAGVSGLPLPLVLLAAMVWSVRRRAPRLA